MVKKDCIFHGPNFNKYRMVGTCEALTHIECENCCFYKSINDYEWCEYFNPAGNKVPGVRKKGD